MVLVLAAVVSILIITFYIPGTWGQPGQVPVTDQMCQEYCGKNCFYKYHGRKYMECHQAKLSCDCSANPPKVVQVNPTKPPNPKHDPVAAAAFTLRVPPGFLTQKTTSQPEPKKSSELSSDVIIALAVVAVLGVYLLCSVFCCLSRLRKKQAMVAPNQPQDAVYPVQEMQVGQPQYPYQPQYAGQGQQYPYPQNPGQGQQYPYPQNPGQGQQYPYPYSEQQYAQYPPEYPEEPERRHKKKKKTKPPKDLDTLSSASSMV